VSERKETLNVDGVLGEGGVIARYIDGFQPRQSQLDMARLIDESIQQGRDQLIEASTGIGKSFAYLTPVFLRDIKTLISTGTKNLQDQLFNKDIPLINKTILSGKKLALLKGRSNYACLHRIAKHRQSRRFQTRNMALLFDALSEWAATSRAGDIAEFAELPESDSLWFYATSTADNCLGGDCPEYNDCFVARARRKAQEADIVVINHHLFFADQALKEQGFGELLPAVDVVIFDEAHQLPDVAGNFFSQSLSKRQFDQLLKDVEYAQASEARDSAETREFLAPLQKTLDELLLRLSRFANKGEWRNIRNAPPMVEVIQDLCAQLSDLRTHLDVIKARGRELGACFNRLQEQWTVLEAFLEPDEDRVAWYEWHERGFRLMLSPIEITGQFQQQLANNDFDCVIMTSATLSADNRFDYFSKRLGLEGVANARFNSPFDYKNHALLYLPPNMPEPSSPQFINAFINECVELLKATEGNAFLLFTSYRMLTLTANALEKRVGYPLFVQGRKQRSELLAEYMASDNAVLLGTSSFWEGVDVKGDKLKLVIIDKLPFKSPGDPVYRHRLQRAAQQGGNAFMDIQVPEAIIALRQGVGRLIRDATDRGIVMIADSRLQTKPYGRQMLDSLPEMDRTSDPIAVRRFAQLL
jgi:ATP-dependent DNA helicase DinG